MKERRKYQRRSTDQKRADANADITRWETKLAKHLGKYEVIADRITLLRDKIHKAKLHMEPTNAVG